MRPAVQVDQAVGLLACRLVNGVEVAGDRQPPRPAVLAGGELAGLLVNAGVGRQHRPGPRRVHDEARGVRADEDPQPPFRRAIPVARGKHAPGGLVGVQVPGVPRPGGDGPRQRDKQRPGPRSRPPRPALPPPARSRPGSPPPSPSGAGSCGRARSEDRPNTIRRKTASSALSRSISASRRASSSRSRSFASRAADSAARSGASASASATAPAPAATRHSEHPRKPEIAHHTRRAATT